MKLPCLWMWRRVCWRFWIGAGNGHIERSGMRQRLGMGLVEGLCPSPVPENPDDEGAHQCYHGYQDGNGDGG